MPEQLEDLPNLGTEAASWLRTAGISTPDELRRLGSVQAYAACAAAHDAWSGWHVLYAFEGAIRGVRWHAIPKEERDALRADVERVLGD